MTSYTGTATGAATLAADSPVTSAAALAAALDPGGPLGPRESWPAGLAAVLETVLSAPLPMALACGPELVLAYNDHYAALIGHKHPQAFGRPAPEVFAENWSASGHGEVVAQVLRTGDPFFEAETWLPVRRRGGDAPPERVLFSRAYSAVRGDDGCIIGVLTVISETTDLAKALAALADLASRLATSLTVDDVAREALRYAIAAFGADHSRVLLAEGTALRMARQSRDDADDESAERLPPLWSRIPDSTSLPSVRVVRDATPLWLDEAALGGFSALVEEPIGPVPLRAAAAVPLHNGSVAGAYSLGWEQPREFTPSERAAIVTVGRLIGQAVARASRFDEQRGHADMLQRSMLPAELPHVAGVGIAARYEPSAPGTSAGGDFYDVFETADGRLVLVIGDVVGHGVLAAAVMGQLRAGLRVLALQDPSPAAVLAGLDAFVDSIGPETFATALVGLLDPASGRLELATAGHLPPLVRRVGEPPTVEFLELPPSPPIGLAAPRSTETVWLGRGDVLLLYTDGLVEVPREDIDTGLGRLRDLVATTAVASDPRRLCGAVVDRLGSGTDDVAVLVVMLDDGERRTASTTVPPDSTSPGVARTWTARALAAWGLRGDLVDVALLGVNELVTNALLHARTAARVELDLDDHRLLVLVSDGGLTGELEPQESDPSASRGRGLLLVEALTDAWGSERSSRGTTVWFELAVPVTA
jgi:anti-sigma regulatory factor (Ser/Thr protein kinase)